jgi:threonine dehydratase
MAPPFDHDDIIEGQATVAAEIRAQLPEGENPDLIVLPVGGGGLSAGVSRYLEGEVATSSYLLSEPAGAPSLKQSLSEGRRIKLEQDRQLRRWRGCGQNRRAELRDPHTLWG